MPDDSATIVLSRPKAYRDRIRAYKVKVDGERLGRIKHGSEESFEIAPGKHSVRCTIDWASSNTVEIDVAPGGTLPMVIQPNGGPLSAYWQGMIRPNTYLLLEPAPPA